MVTWSDFSLGVGGATGDSSVSAVKAQVFDADGAMVGSEILVNTATANTQDFPADYGAVEWRLRGDLAGLQSGRRRRDRRCQ